MKLVYVTARFSRFSYYGDPIKTVRTELYCDEAMTEEQIAIAKRNAAKTCQYEAHAYMTEYKPGQIANND